MNHRVDPALGDPALGDPTRAAGLRFPDQLVFRGYSAPVRIEADVYDLEVDGRLPFELNGAYYRNSADPQYPPRLGTDIFLNGDGMVHRVRFEDGHADLKTRYVKTDKLLAERKARRGLFGAYRNPFTDAQEAQGMSASTANTSILWHHGTLLALKESSRPMRLDPATLETLGWYDFGGTLGTSQTFTAHPKLDPETGEAIAFAYNTGGRSSNDISVYWISPAGRITRSETFAAPYCSMVHDFHVSRNYIAFSICPMVNDWERVQRGEPFFHWDSTLQTQIGIIPRREGVAAIRWFTCPVVAMQTHTFNAWEETGERPGKASGKGLGPVLHLDHFVTGSGWLSQFPDLHDREAKEKPPFAQRWSFDLGSDATTFAIRKLFEHVGEMPMVDARYLMRRANHFWFGTSNTSLGPMLEYGPKGPPFTCIGHFDEAASRLDYWYAGPDSAPEEPVFVPRSADAAEGDGWLLTIVGRRKENRTDLVVLDALRLCAGPVATVRMPCRLHEGFHGVWIGERELVAAGA